MVSTSTAPLNPLVAAAVNNSTIATRLPLVTTPWQSVSMPSLPRLRAPAPYSMLMIPSPILPPARPRRCCPTMWQATTPFAAASLIGHHHRPKLTTHLPATGILTAHRQTTRRRHPRVNPQPALAMTGRTGLMSQPETLLARQDRGRFQPPRQLTMMISTGSQASMNKSRRRRQRRIGQLRGEHQHQSDRLLEKRHVRLRAPLHPLHDLLLLLRRDHPPDGVTPGLWTFCYGPPPCASRTSTICKKPRFLNKRVGCWHRWSMQ